MSSNIQNNEYFKTIFNSVKIGIIVTDDNFNIINFNNEIVNMFLYSRIELSGININKILNDLNLMDIVNYENSLIREAIALKKNKIKFPIQFSISKFKNLNKEEYTFIINDFSLIKDKEKKLKYYAYFDHLTDLPNRTLFYDRCEIALNQAKRSNELMSLLFIDLDGFKPINDKYGHETGDQALKLFSQGLINSARDSDTVARLGGDEFIILMPRVTSELDSIELSKRILKSNNCKYSINDNEIILNCSIGISIYPKDGDNINKLVDYADKAMYTSKNKGTNLFSTKVE